MSIWIFYYINIYIFRYDVFSRKPFFSSIQGLRPRNRRKVLCVRQLLNLSVCTQHAAAWHSMSYKQQCQQTKVVKGNWVYLSITKLCSQTSDLRTKVHHLPAIYNYIHQATPSEPLLHPPSFSAWWVESCSIWSLAAPECLSDLPRPWMRSPDPENWKLWCAPDS